MRIIQNRNDKFTCGWEGAEAGEGAEGGAADRLSASVASDAVGIDRALDIDGISDEVGRALDIDDTADLIDDIDL